MEHWFGTDELAATVSRVMYGARIACSALHGVVFGCAIASCWLSSARTGVWICSGARHGILLAFPHCSWPGHRVDPRSGVQNECRVPSEIRGGAGRSGPRPPREENSNRGRASAGRGRRRVVLQTSSPPPAPSSSSCGATGWAICRGGASYLGLGTAEPTPSWGLRLSRSALYYAERA